MGDNYEKNIYQRLEESVLLLQNGKSAEKKLQQARITELLDVEMVVLKLDEYTFKNKLKPSSRLDWNSLFLTIQQHTLIELNQIKDKSKNSLTENKFVQMRALLILILSKVNSRGQNNLKLSLFYDLLVLLFENDLFRQSNKLLNDLSSFFLTNVITKHEYCCEIEKTNWLYLINVFTTKYLAHQQGLPSIDPVIALKCLRMILNKCHLYIGCFILSKLYSFFNLVILNLKRETNNDIIENCIGSALACFTNFSCDSLYEICKLGDEITPKLNELLASKQSSQSIKESICKIYQIQISLHKKIHQMPQIDLTNWKNLLKEIFESLMDELYPVCYQKIQQNSKTKTTNQPESLVMLYAKTAADCLLELIVQNKSVNDKSTLSTDTNLVDETMMDCSSDNILCENTSFRCTSNKKRKIEIEWSWSLFVQELKSDKDDQYLYAWNLLLVELIKLNQIPKKFTIQIIDYLNKKIDELDTNDFNNKRVNVASRKLDLNAFKSVYFNSIYLILKHNHEVDLVKSKVSINSINKTLDYFYKQLNMNEDSYFHIFIDILNMNRSFKVNNSYFDMIVEKFVKLLSKSEAIDIETEFLRLISIIVTKIKLNESTRLELIHAILKPIKIACEETEIENTTLSTFRAKDKLNVSLTQSALEAKSKANLTNKLKNFNPNFFLISRILQALIDIYNPDVETKDKIDVQILEFSCNRNDDIVKRIDRYYNKLMNYKYEQNESIQTGKTMQIFNLSNCKLIIGNLLERIKEICQANDFNMQLDVLSQEFVDLNKLLLNEYFLQLDFCSNVLIHLNEFQSNNNKDELEINVFIKKIKNLCSLILFNCKKLLKSFQTDLPMIEKKTCLSQLNFILTEFLINYHHFIRSNPTKILVFLHTMDMKLIETILQIVSINNDCLDEPASSSLDLQNHEDLKVILNELSISIMSLKKSINDLNRLKLIGLSFLSYVSVEYSYFRDSTSAQAEFNTIGKSLKKNLFQFVFNSYFERFSDSIVLKNEILAKKSNTHNLLSILLFLNGISYKSCSILNWNEYKLCLNMFDSLIANNYFNLCSDPIISKIVFEILSKYSNRLLMVYSFLSWYEANLNQIVPNLSSQHLNALKTTLTSLERTQDQFIELVDSVYQSSCLNLGSKNTNHFSPDVQLQIGKLLGKVLEIYRLRILNRNFKIRKNDDEEKRSKKEALRRLYDVFDKMLNFSDSSIRSNVLKLNMIPVIMKSAFNRYLFRNYLEKYLVNAPVMSSNVFEERDMSYFEIVSTNYLNCLSYFVSQDSSNRKSDFYLINDEFEDVFFDKFYTNQTEKFEIFELSLTEFANENSYLSKTDYKIESFEEKHNQNKKLFVNIRKQFDESFFFKHQLIASLQHLLEYQYFISNVRTRRKCEIKCLFALMHLSTEYRSLFDQELVGNSIRRIGNLFNYSNNQEFLTQYKTELFYQWLEINNYIGDDEIQLDSFNYKIFGHDDFLAFLDEFIADLTSYCFIKSDRHLLDKSKKLQRLLFMAPSNNEKNLITLLNSNHRFTINFYSKTFLTIFLNKLTNEQRFNLIDLLVKQNLFNSELLKKHFHFMLMQFFINLSNNYLHLNNDEPRGNWADLEQLILNAIETLVNIYIESSQVKNQDRTKILISLIQININDHLEFTAQHQALTSIYSLIFNINRQILKQNNMFYNFSFFQLYKIFLKCFLLSNPDQNASISLISGLVNKNNYQIFLHNFITFKLGDCINICKRNLLKFKSLNDLTDKTEFYEINVFNIRFITSIRDVLTHLITHLEMNKLEISYFDLPLSCLIWNFLDYLNLSECLSLKLEFVSEFNLNLFEYLHDFIEKNSEFSIRFKRLSNFLNLVTDSEIDASNNSQLAFVLMLNLSNFSNKSRVSSQKGFHFEEELKECLESADFDRSESSKYILCYLSNLLAIEFKNKTCLLNRTDSIKQLLRKFINKLINICASQNLNDSLKELTCFCLSLIGPIDFQSHHLPVDINAKYDMKYVTPEEYSTKHRRSFILQNFSNNSDTMIHLYYLLIEYLIEYLTSDNLNLSIISNDLLFKIFRTPNSVLFLNEYEKYSAEFTKVYSEASINEDDNSVDYFYEYMKPFLSKKPRSLDLDVLQNRNLENITDVKVWFYEEKSSYEKWIRNLISVLTESILFKDEVCITCRPIFDKDVTLCEISLPYILDHLLWNNDRLSEAVGTNVNMVLEKILIDSQTNANCPKHLLSLYINVIDFFRRKSIKITNNCKFWINSKFLSYFDYLTVAQCAQLCGFYIKSLYFIEAWYDDKIHENTIMDVAKVKPKVLELIMNAYKNVGEKSALNSNLIYLIHSNDRIKFYEDDNFDEALYTYDNILAKSDINVNAQIGIINAFSNIGLENTLKNYLTSNRELQKEYKDLADIKYYNSWKLGIWTNESTSEIETYNKNYHSALKYYVQKDKNESSLSKILNIIDQTQAILFDQLTSISVDLTYSIYPILTSFYNLNQIKKFCTISNLNEFLTNELILLLSYESNYFSKSESFHLNNDLLASRSILAQSLLKSQSTSETSYLVKNYLASIYNKIIENAVAHKRFQIALSNISEMRNYSIYEIQCDLKETELLREKCDLQRAKFIIKNSIDGFSQQIKTRSSSPFYDKKIHIEYYIKALDLYAKILNDTKSINPSIIISDYLEKAIEFAKHGELGSPKELSNSFYSLGKFVDEQYQTICNYVKSTSYEEHTELMRQFQIEKSKVQEVDPNSHFNFILHKQFEIDNEEIKCLYADRDEYLCKSVESYLSCLELSQFDTNNQLQNVCIFRLVSLWTQNTTNTRLNKIIKEKIFKIPTYKFRILMHQLAARMSLKNAKLTSEPNESLFQQTLIELVLKITLEHPYHVLPIILAFSNSHKDLAYASNTTPSSSKSSSSSKSKNDDSETSKLLMAEDRVNTANYLISTIKSKSTNLKSIVESTQFVCDAYIELANAQVSKQKGKEAIVFPKHLLINKVKNFNLVHVLTHTMPINLNGIYDENNLIHIVKFDNTFRLANGINLPKIILCWGSDGVARKQLVKGKDDLRQDAVMQQFFETVNDLIRMNSNRNKLRPIRTYKIVPLSQKSGVLEWCQNTITFGDWLTSGDINGGAHKKYEPNDLLAEECKRRLYEVGDQVNKTKKLSKKVKLETYLEICRNFKPVFRYFFTENYLETNDWFEKRLNYTRSVATSSIVGYIIGLGDRHVQNILIDLDSADLIHIDLGIAFDQGKILPTPETVPFRLTRDIVDGFGVCGIEGLFKNCCESMLDILKTAKDQILTIFEVLLYDPLHNWSISPQKACMLQRNQNETADVASDQPDSLLILNASESHFGSASLSHESSHKTNKTNKIAERILFRLKQKLQGYENGTQLSTNGHVNFLINEAINPENLCRIYCGWQPYL